jgi:hypothetical protein
MLSAKKWNQPQYERDWHEKPEVRHLPQSKGNCRMKTVPKQGDIAHFIYKKKLVMKGIVHSDGFETGIYHQIHHSCNIGKNREHTTSPEFAWVDITEVGLSEDVRHTGQQTWIMWTEDMRI